jgi:hypothetical protein
VADLFTLEELASYLQQDLDASTATNVRRIASGWLRSATALADWPSPVSDQLFAWGLELAAIAYRNPEGLTSERVDDYQASYDASRRLEILAAARRDYSGAGAPTYSFPEPDWHWTAVAVVED